MLIYEVNLDVHMDIAGSYAAWLGPHIQEVLAVDGFTSAEWWTVDHDASRRVYWCVQYRVRDRAALDAYTEHHAPRLRGDGLTRFGGRYAATRRVMELRDAEG